MELKNEEIMRLLESKSKSVLFPAKDNLLELRNSGVTLSTLKVWLCEKYGIETSCENIRQFCIRHGQIVITQNKKEKESESNREKLFANILKD